MVPIRTIGKESRPEMPGGHREDGELPEKRGRDGARAPSAFSAMETARRRGGPT